jgi:hypothetical protein
MTRVVTVFLAVVLAFSWADDFYCSTATPDPSDDTCTESDIVVVPVTGRELIESRLVLRVATGHGDARVSSARSTKVPTDSTSKRPPRSVQLSIFLGTVVPIRC